MLYPQKVGKEVGHSRELARLCHRGSERPCKDSGLCSQSHRKLVKHHEQLSEAQICSFFQLLYEALKYIEYN